MKSKIILCLISIFLIINVTGCKKDSSMQKHDGNSFKINDIEFTKSPDKVVVLSDSLADIILATSNELKLVGKSLECTQKELKILPDVGSKNSPDINKIMDLNPDLILTDINLNPDITSKLSDTGIKILILPIANTKTDLENLYGNIGQLFALKEGREKAITVCKKILSYVDDITRINAGNNIVITSCYIYDENGSVATGDTFAGQLLSYAGTTNIADDSINNTMTINGIKLSNPNYIFCPAEIIDTILNSENYKSTSAVSSGHVYPLEKSAVTRQGKTILETVKYIHKTINDKRI